MVNENMRWILYTPYHVKCNSLVDNFLHVVSVDSTIVNMKEENTPNLTCFD
jgi:hypothetical protein